MSQKKNEPDGFCQMLLLAAFFLPLIYMNDSDPLKWIFIGLSGASIFNMMLNSHSK